VRAGASLFLILRKMRITEGHGGAVREGVFLERFVPSGSDGLNLLGVPERIACRTLYLIWLKGLT